MTDAGWRQSPGVNVFEMFVAHGGPGFWVRRITWSGTCARVIRVGAIAGPAPYYGNPSVLMDVYTLDGRLKDSAAQLPVPGTYKTWRKIDPPPWASAVALRPLDDPQLDAALARLDKKRHKSGAVGGEPKIGPPTELVFLKVAFARKDEAKRLGARWSPLDKKWWLPAENAAAIDEARDLGFLD